MFIVYSITQIQIGQLFENYGTMPDYLGISDGVASQGRMFGISTGDPSTDFEAGMWLMGLVATLAAAVPLAFLSPNLGFKRRRRQANDFIQRINYHEKSSNDP